MNRVLYWASAIAVGLAIGSMIPVKVCAAEREETRIYDRDNKRVGSSVKRGNTETFYDNSGRRTGQAVTRGNETRIYDSNNRRVGTAKTRSK